MGIRSLNRWQAFAIHLSLSILLAAGVFLLFWQVWYPGAFFSASGADRLLLLVVGVDIILGPMLTLIVFAPAKKSLRFDLAVIAALQLAGLSYGAHVILASRPVFLVGTVDRFKLVSANEVTDSDLAAAARPEFAKRSWTGPILVGARIPSDPEEAFDIVQNVMAGGPDIERMPKLYLPLDEIAGALRERAIPLDRLQAKDKQGRDLAAALATAHGPREREQIALLPIDARFGSVAMLVDLRTGTFVGPIAFDAESALKRP